MKHLHISALFLILVSASAWKGKNETGLLTDTVTAKSTNITVAQAPSNIVVERANFSGEWIFNESKSERDNKFPVCLFGEGDRALSKTMKVDEHPDFMTVTVTKPLPHGKLSTIQEIVTFDGKESEATNVGWPREKSGAKWSDDGQVLTITSVKSFGKISDDPDIKVTEVWKLINDGNALSVQVIASSVSGENIMQLVYDKP